MANWVRYPLPLFCAFPPWRACEVEVRYPSLQKGYLSDTCAIRYENNANGCDTPLCDTISKGYCAIWGGISHWAAKLLCLQRSLACWSDGHVDAAQLTIVSWHRNWRASSGSIKEVRVVLVNHTNYQKCTSDPRPPTCTAKIWTKIWTKYDPKCFKNKANSTVLGPYFCSYFGLVCGGWGLQMIPQIRWPWAVAYFTA